MQNPGFSPNLVFNPAAPALPAGTLLAQRYRVVSLLGQGGFGRTYQAIDSNRFDEPCVLKEFAPQVQSAADAQLAQTLFQREAGVLYRLNHPQIPRFREIRQLEHAGYAYLLLVQDFVEGTTYRDLLNQKINQNQLNQNPNPNPNQHQPSQGSGLDIDIIIALLEQLLPVLEYLHRNGVIHRDISPDNLIQRQGDRLPILIDFGAVKQIVATVISQVSQSSQGIQGIQSSQYNSFHPAPPTSSLRQVNPGTCIGKQGFAPPEQFQSGQAFPHSDLYALGATALTLLTGSEPGQLIDPNSLEWRLPAMLQQHPSLARILQRMLALRPSDRYPSASLVLADLQQSVLQPRVVSAPQSPPSPRATAVGPTQAPRSRASGPSVAQPGFAASQMGTVAVSPPQPPATPQHSPRAAIAPASSGAWAKLLGSTGLALLVITGGMLLGRHLWLSNSSAPPTITPEFPQGDRPTPEDKPAAPPAPQLPPAEQARKQRLLERRQQVDVPETYLNQLVNGAFYQRHPELQGRKLNRYESDADLRAEWDELAFGWLDQLERLPQERRRELGSYSEQVRDRWIQQVNQKRLGSRALNDLVTAQFRPLFPELNIDADTTGPQAQLWRAVAVDTVADILSGAALQRLSFKDKTASHASQLAPHRGIVHTIELKKGQSLRLSLEKTSDEGALSVAFYPPYRNQAALLPLSELALSELASAPSELAPSELSPAELPPADPGIWEGTVDSDGFYEVVVIAGGGAVDYSLNLLLLVEEAAEQIPPAESQPALERPLPKSQNSHSDASVSEGLGGGAGVRVLAPKHRNASDVPVDKTLPSQQ